MSPVPISKETIVAVAIFMMGCFALWAWVVSSRKRRAEAERIRIQLEAELTLLSQAAAAIQSRVFDRLGRAYLNRKRYLSIRGEFQAEFAQFESRAAELEKLYPWLFKFIRDAGFQDEFNARVIARQKRDFAPFFKSIDEKGFWLTETQLDAVFSDEDAVLVNAGAGTWKTKTIESKVVHLAKNLWIPLDDVLVMTYSKKSQADMADRIAESLGVAGVAFGQSWLKSNVTTFHSLWKRMLESTVGGGSEALVGLRDARFSVLDDNGRRRIFDSVVRKMKETLTSQDLLTEFALYHLSPQADPSEFETLDDYYKYTKQGLYTQLKQEGWIPVTVKSYWEVLIANFLWSSGVPTQYEPHDHYYTDPSTKEKKAYRPDFFLPAHRVYVEYFWVDSEWNAAPFVSTPDYRSEMMAKLSGHRDSGNRLVDMRYADLQKGAPFFLEKLRNELVKAGVAIGSMSSPDFVNSPDAERPLEWVNKMILSFLALFEESDVTIESLDRRILSWFDRSNADRNSAFLRLFEYFYQEYKSALETEGVIDFGDMIRKSAELIRSGGWSRKFRYVLIDEFQDISKARATLIGAIVSRNPDCRLFCVGDDWQSIYQFAGSDSSIFADFESHFWFTKKITLDRTFRFNQGISDVSSAFVTANPAQTRKSLASIDWSKDGRVVIVKKESDSNEYFLRALSDIAVRDGNAWRSVSVLYLTRYAKTKYRGEPFDTLSSHASGESGDGDSYAMDIRGTHFDIVHMTVHKSKWLETDYVIVDFVDQAAKFAFPSVFEDDPILSMLTNGKGRKGYPYAEERRLFYVALTRWKKRAYVLHSAWSDSPFVDWLSEAANGRFSGTVVSLWADGGFLSVENVAKAKRCKLCKGRLLQRSWKTKFLGCENYPRCTYVEDAPPPICTDCAIPMTKRFNRKERRYFWGCSNYPTCKRTANM